MRKLLKTEEDEERRFGNLLQKFCSLYIRLKFLFLKVYFHHLKYSHLK